MSDSAAARRWRALLVEQAAAGLSDAVFAQRRRINPRTLAWWRSTLRRMDRDAAPVFTELAVVGPVDAAPVSGRVLVAFDRLEAHVVVDDRTDLTLLRRVLEAVS